MAHIVDKHVGMRVRRLREMRGQSQSELAQALDLSFQQVQKYESGANRISASRLYQVCQIYGVDPNYFFEGLEGAASPAKIEMDTRSARAGGLIERIPDSNVRDNLYGLIKVLEKSYG